MYALRKTGIKEEEGRTEFSSEFMFDTSTRQLLSLPTFLKIELFSILPISLIFFFLSFSPSRILFQLPTRQSSLTYESKENKQEMRERGSIDKDTYSLSNDHI
jgi:hypothetical protein